MLEGPRAPWACALMDSQPATGSSIQKLSTKARERVRRNAASFKSASGKRRALTLWEDDGQTGT
jgi:hypothetical protein